MLVLTRGIGDQIVINDEIRITVVAVHGNKIRLGFTGPKSCRVLRGELLTRPRELEHVAEVAVAGQAAT